MCHSVLKRHWVKITTECDVEMNYLAQANWATETPPQLFLQIIHICCFRIIQNFHNKNTTIGILRVVPQSIKACLRYRERRVIKTSPWELYYCIFRMFLSWAGPENVAQKSFTNNSVDTKDTFPYIKCIQMPLLCCFLFM